MVNTRSKKGVVVKKVSDTNKTVFKGKFVETKATYQNNPVYIVRFKGSYPKQAITKYCNLKSREIAKNNPDSMVSVVFKYSSGRYLQAKYGFVKAGSDTPLPDEYDDEDLGEIEGFDFQYT